MPRMERYETGIPCWIDLQTTDVDGAAVFYTAVFGWESDGGAASEGSGYQMFSKDGAAVAAVGPQPPEMVEGGVPPVWLTYLAGKAEEITGRVEGAGGRVLLPAGDVGAIGRLAVIADPSGAPLGIWQAQDRIGVELANEPGTLVWNELYTTDLEASARFLEEVFGVTTEDLAGAPAAYKTFQVGGESRGGIMQMEGDEWEGIPPHWMTYFMVEDTDAGCAAVEEAGGSVRVQPFDTDFGRMAVVADPQGGHFSLMAAPAEAQEES